VQILHMLPPTVIELKDPTDEGADVDAAIDQLGRYVAGAPDLFVANMLLVARRRREMPTSMPPSDKSSAEPWTPVK